ncbi:hypothetical protein AB0I49_32035, partial [Streptomyces sp. NPDC050617]|uniref:hypothetical protein n=1 Tax=Streptomyces sp. NPDC050617 TaxID=3154628 RepID=UPI00343B8DDF
EFSRNGRFLRDRFTGLSGRFPSFLRFRLYQILAALISAGAFRPFSFFAFPTLPDPFSVPFPVGILFRSPSEGVCLSAVSTLSDSFRPN